MSNYLQALLQQASANGSKSTVLKSIGWLLGLLFSSVMVSSALKLDSWIIIMFAVMLIITFFCFFYVYFHFMKINPDYLRSEKFVIDKMAIEHSITGDSNTGIIDCPPTAIKSLSSGGNSNA